MLGDRRGGGLDAHRGEHLVGHPAHGRVPDDGGEADHGHPGLGDRLPDAGHREDGAHGDDRVGRREEDDVRLSDRLQDPGRGLGLLGPHGHDGLGGDRRAEPDPVLLEVDHLALAVHLDGDMRLDAVVRHGDQPHPGLPPVAQRLGDRAEREPGADHLGPHDVRGEVPVAEPEPLGPDAVGPEFFLEVEGLVGPAPALLLVDTAAEGVHHRVEVRADLQPEEVDVVPRVADHRDVRVRHGLLETAQEPGTTDTACQNHNAHGDKSCRRVRQRGRQWPHRVRRSPRPPGRTRRAPRTPCASASRSGRGSRRAGLWPVRGCR